MVNFPLRLVALVALAAALWVAPARAQLGLGVQAPLAVVGGVAWGPLQLEAGLPLRFDLAQLGAFVNAKWLLGEWTPLEGLSARPFFGAGAALDFARMDEVQWRALAGLQAQLEGGLALYVQLGASPGFAKGLIESLNVGVRFGF